MVGILKNSPDTIVLSKIFREESDLQNFMIAPASLEKAFAFTIKIES
jgi:hypothetical protein